MRSYYVVISGRNPGIYDSWSECNKQVNGVRGAKFNKFGDKSEAERFFQSHFKPKDKTDNVMIPAVNRTISYTDGSSTKSGAGYCALILKESNPIQYFGPVPSEDGSIPTNNRAELYAIAVAIHNSEGPLNVMTDSEYAVSSLTTYVYSWKQNDWKNSRGETIANIDLIKYLHEAMLKRDIKLIHVKGHSGDKWNELADQLAKKGSVMYAQ